MRSSRDTGARTPSILYVVVPVMLVLLLPLFWSKVAPRMSTPMSYFARAQMTVFPWFSKSAADAAADLNELRRRREVLSYDGLKAMLDESGRYLSYLLIPALLLAAGATYRIAAPQRQKTKRFSAQDLINFQAAYWAASSPLVGIDLASAEHQNHPYARRALKPPEWAVLVGAARDVKLVLLKDNGERLYFDETAPAGATEVERKIPRERIGKELFLLTGCTFDPNAAEAAFIAQLGRRFTRWESMPAHYFGVVCYLLSHIGPDRQLEWEIQYELMASKGVAGPKAKQAWQQHRKHEVLTRIAQHHHWNATAIRALFAESKRLGGKVESWWVWLKAVDYGLYINLNEDGRLVAWVESAGVRAQLNAERTMAEINAGMARRAEDQLTLQAPAVEPAVKALMAFLNDIGAIDESGVLLDSPV